MTGTATIDAFQAALIAASVGQSTSSATDWMIYRGMMQDGDPAPSQKIANKCLALNDLPGLPPLEAWLIDYPGVQVMGRGDVDGYVALRNKMQDVFDALHAQEAAVSDQIVWLYAQMSAPMLLGFDERRRPKMFLNFKLMRNRPT